VKIGDRVRFVDDHGRESVGIVRDDKGDGRLAWQGRPSLLIQEIDPEPHTRAWWWVLPENVQPDSEDQE
jgi:hypothetical protein